MYNAIIKISKFLLKHKFLYFFLNFTWGLLLEIVGSIIALLMILTLHRPMIKERVICFRVGGQYWGGFSVGSFIFVCDSTIESLYLHEYGHSYQSAIFGPFMPFIVSIPSAIRYWHQTIRQKQGKDNKPYESIWFEKQATEIGHLTKEVKDNEKTR